MVVEQIGTFGGGYGTLGVIEILCGSQCSLCKAEGRVTLYSDGSAGEYAGAAICGPCLENILKKLRNHADLKAGEEGDVPPVTGPDGRR